MTEVMVYTPPASVVGFLTATKFINLQVGPVGSTKTTAGIMKIAYHAKQMARCKDGIRRSRAVWVRNTREQLKDTSIPDFLQWFPDGVAGTYLKTDYKFILKFDDVECEVLFRGLDDSNDVRRLLSLQASFGILDEFREIRRDIFEALQGRLGRYPSKLHNGVGCVTDTGEDNKRIWGMSNPPDMDTYWEQFLSEPPENAAVFFQPSALSPDADWLDYLPMDYYPNLAQGKTEDWVDVYINAKFGKTLAGRPVFRTFDSDFHVAKERLKHLKTSEKPIIVGIDFGLNPSATFCQLDYKGKLLVYAAVTSDGMGLERFLDTKVKPMLADRFPGLPVVFVGDPAGSQRVQTNEGTCFEMLRRAGFKAIPAKTNAILPRIAAVETFLNRQIDSGPGFLLDPEGCKPLITAMRGGYRYKLKTSGEFDDKPEKNEHSHIADALQYACLHADSGISGLHWRGNRRDIQHVSSAGWT
jgi:hypothetical protein